MNRTPRCRLVITLLALMGMGAPGLVQALSVADLLARIDDSYEVRVARSARDAAAKTLASLGYPGSPELSVDPAVKATTPVGGSFAQQVDLAGTISLRVPLGLTATVKEKYNGARLALSLAEAELLAARSSAYVRLFGLYQEAWLARTELEILDLEVGSARGAAETAERRYEAGEISLAELKKAEDDLSKAQDALLSGDLEQRLSWLSLLYASGQERHHEDQLESPLRDAIPLPDVSLLVDWSLQHSPSVIEQRARVEEATRSLDELRTVPLELDARITGSSQAHSASVSFATETPQLAATYSFPIATFGTLGSVPSSGTPTWTLGISVGVAVDVGRERRLQSEALEAGLLRETARLDSLLRTVELGIRSKYQQWIKSGEAVEQSRRVLDRAREAQNIVEAKFSLGQATDADRLIARASLERAQWNLSKAKALLEEARLAAADAAGYLDKMLGLAR